MSQFIEVTTKVKSYLINTDYIVGLSSDESKGYKTAITLSKSMFLYENKTQGKEHFQFGVLESYEDLKLKIGLL